jgi:two-component system, OmpR family, catabolic regulation response regulator CreB
MAHREPLDWQARSIPAPPGPANAMDGRNLGDVDDRFCRNGKASLRYNRVMSAATNSKLLVHLVEDEPAIAGAVAFALDAEGFRCLHVSTGADCLRALREENPALILLDIGLPDGNGFDFFRQIRAVSSAPVVFLTARKEEIDRVVGLEMGADDYVVKPFSLRELMARVRMVIRRGASAAATRATGAIAAESASPATGPFVRDGLRRQIRFFGHPLDLTLHEYQLLDALLNHPGRVFTRSQLLDLAWEAPDHRLDRTVDSHIKSVRAKLREVNDTVDPIRTHRGMGYSLEDSP